MPYVHCHMTQSQFASYHKPTSCITIRSACHVCSVGCPCVQALSTWITCDGIEACRRGCGGHGYSLLSGLPTLYASYVQNATWEGDNNVLCLQVNFAPLQHRYVMYIVLYAPHVCTVALHSHGHPAHDLEQASLPHCSCTPPVCIWLAECTLPAQEPARLANRKSPSGQRSLPGQRQGRDEEQV